MSSKIVTRIEALRTRAMIGSPDDIGFLRKQVSAANRAVLAAAGANANMAGLQGTAEALAQAQADERSAKRELARAQQRIADAAATAVPDIAAIAAELAEAAFALAQLMKDVDQHAANLAKKHLTVLHDRWAMVDAGARALRSAAENLGPQPAMRSATLRWTA
jgi:hypothetical protein